MTDAKAVFVDTNVLVYAYDELSPYCAVARDMLAALGSAGHSLWISGQSVREFCAVVSRPGWTRSPVSPKTLREYAASLLQDFRLAPENDSGLHLLLEMLVEFGVQGRRVFDLHLVATMRANGIVALLTHNVNDFAMLEPYVQIIPLSPPGR